MTRYRIADDLAPGKRPREQSKQPTDAIRGGEMSRLQVEAARLQCREEGLHLPAPLVKRRSAPRTRSEVASTRKRSLSSVSLPTRRTMMHTATGASSAPPDRVRMRTRAHPLQMDRGGCVIVNALPRCFVLPGSTSELFQQTTVCPCRRVLNRRPTARHRLHLVLHRPHLVRQRTQPTIRRPLGVLPWVRRPVGRTRACPAGIPIGTATAIGAARRRATAV